MSSINRANVRVLIIEDEATTRLLVKQVLKQSGFTDVVAVDRATEAKKLITHDSADLILLDWYLPEMDGIEFLETIKSHRKKIPVIMVTSEGDPANVKKAIDAGCSGYVVKPVTPAILLKQIDTVLGIKSPDL